MRRTFREIIGPALLRADGFLNLNPQLTDMRLLPITSRVIVRVSEMLRRLSVSARPLIYIADSVYVEARTPPTPVAVGWRGAIAAPRQSFARHGTGALR